MPPTSTTAAVREALAGDVNTPADEVIRRVREAGVTASDASIRDAVYNVKSELRKAAKKAGARPAKSAPKPVPAAARATAEPERASPGAPAPVPVAPPADLRAVLANVALVNDVLAACGGVEAVRKVAEAVQACGGVEAFLLHVDLVAQVRGAATAVA